MLSFKSSAAPDAVSSPKCLKSTATIPTPTCSISVRSMLHRENMDERPHSVLTADALSFRIRPGAPLSRRPGRRSCTEPRSRTDHATHPCRGGNRKSAFLYWLTEQNERGADIFLGMNPIKENSYSRTKENIREVRHVYLDLDENASRISRRHTVVRGYPYPQFCPRYLSRETPGDLAGRRTKFRARIPDDRMASRDSGAF